MEKNNYQFGVDEHKRKLANKLEELFRNNLGDGKQKVYPFAFIIDDKNYQICFTFEDESIETTVALSDSTDNPVTMSCKIMYRNNHEQDEDWTAKRKEQFWNLAKSLAAYFRRPEDCKIKIIKLSFREIYKVFHDELIMRMRKEQDSKDNKKERVKKSKDVLMTAIKETGSKIGKMLQEVERHNESYLNKRMFDREYSRSIGPASICVSKPFEMPLNFYGVDYLIKCAECHRGVSVKIAILDEKGGIVAEREAELWGHGWYRDWDDEFSSAWNGLIYEYERQIEIHRLRMGEVHDDDLGTIEKKEKEEKEEEEANKLGEEFREFKEKKERKKKSSSSSSSYSSSSSFRSLHHDDGCFF